MDFLVGEDSVGEWLSGALLIMSSTIAAIIASKRGWSPWAVFSVFFFLLAIDENFMIHEAIKRTIVFTSYEQTNQPVYWIGEIPVIIVACIGAIVAWIMWKNINKKFRWLIIVGVVFGTLSVIFDVLSLGVTWEDRFKLLGELAVACSLATEVQHDLIKN